MVQIGCCQEAGTGRGDLCVGGRLQCLDTDLFLDEYPQWRADGPQCPYILQRMFMHAEEVQGRKSKSKLFAVAVGMVQP